MIFTLNAICGNFGYAMFHEYKFIWIHMEMHSEPSWHVCLHVMVHVCSDCHTLLWHQILYRSSSAVNLPSGRLDTCCWSVLVHFITSANKQMRINRSIFQELSRQIVLNSEQCLLGYLPSPFTFTPRHRPSEVTNHQYDRFSFYLIILFVPFVLFCFNFDHLTASFM